MVALDRSSGSGEAHAILRTLLRCPECGSQFRWAEDLMCAAGHAYPVVKGIPRLVRSNGDTRHAALVAATSEAFGRQWTELSRYATVGLSDLMLHLPSGWGPSTFSGLVLDAGCGSGRYAGLVARLGAVVVGLDLSKAVEAAATAWPNVAFVQGDLAAPPFAAESFDLVYSFGVLHHLPDPLHGLRMCFRLVRPGGRLVVWVYSAHGGLWRRGRRLARALVSRVPGFRTPLAWAAAVAIWTACVLPRRAGIPGIGGLRFYADKGLKQVFVDCHDALAAPKEIYLTADDCRHWLSQLEAAEAGFEARRDGSGWILWAKKKG